MVKISEWHICGLLVELIFYKYKSFVQVSFYLFSHQPLHLSGVGWIYREAKLRQMTTSPPSHRVTWLYSNEYKLWVLWQEREKCWQSTCFDWIYIIIGRKRKWGRGRRGEVIWGEYGETYLWPFSGHNSAALFCSLNELTFPNTLIWQPQRINTSLIRLLGPAKMAGTDQLHTEPISSFQRWKGNLFCLLTPSLTFPFDCCGEYQLVLIAANGGERFCDKSLLRRGLRPLTHFM